MKYIETAIVKRENDPDEPKDRETKREQPGRGKVTRKKTNIHSKPPTKDHTSLATPNKHN